MASNKITLEQLNALGMKRLADLVIQECQERPQFEQRIQRALTAISDTNGLISLVKQDLTRLSRGKKFYFARASQEFANELSEIHNAIVKEVAPLDVEAAIELGRKFLSLHNKVFERVDDSYGNIWPIFDGVLEDLAALYQQSDIYDTTTLAENVFDWHCHNNYGIYDNVIKYFVPVLGTDGCHRLEQLLRQQVEEATPASESLDFTRTRGISGLLSLADARQDVDGYISIVETYHSPISPYHKIDIIQRLVNAKRYEEALGWIDSLESSTRFDNEKRLLTIQTLEGLGQTEAAQAVRIEEFNSSLSENLYKDCLEHSDSPETLREQLLSTAKAHPSTSLALSFFISIGELEQAAQLVCQNQAEWDGHNYYTLQPAAKALEDAWPLASTILYRALIEDILLRAQSKYYHHAVRYMKALESISPQIQSWGDLTSHNQYFSALQEAHKRKKALWHKYSQ